jgi:hypothetical protein
MCIPRNEFEYVRYVWVHTCTHTHTHIYTYSFTRTHTHTCVCLCVYIYIYIYIYHDRGMKEYDIYLVLMGSVCVCVCMCVCVRMRSCAGILVHEAAYAFWSELFLNFSSSVNSLICNIYVYRQDKFLKFSSAVLVVWRWPVWLFWALCIVCGLAFSLLWSTDSLYLTAEDNDRVSRGNFVSSCCGVLGCCDMCRSCLSALDMKLLHPSLRRNSVGTFLPDHPEYYSARMSCNLNYRIFR